MIGLNVSYNTDDDVVNVESSEGMKQLRGPCNSYWMHEGWGLLPHWLIQMRQEKHSHEMLKDVPWLIRTRLCKQSHVAEMMSFGEGIPYGSPH